jgi:hypothetical protein
MGSPKTSQTHPHTPTDIDMQWISGAVEENAKTDHDGGYLKR